jgi:hypothetical protein
MKNTSSNISGMTSALVLAALVLATGIVVPGYCQDRSLPGPGTEALPTNPSWIPTGNLTTPRSFHTATLLPGGNVLVVASW